MDSCKVSEDLFQPAVTMVAKDPSLSKEHAGILLASLPMLSTTSAYHNTKEREGCPYRALGIQFGWTVTEIVC